MGRKLVALVVLVAVVAVAAGGVLALDVLPGSGDSGTDIEEFPTETPHAEDGTAGGTSTATPSPPFGFTIDAIAECGETCRDVTSTLTNQQDDTDTNVTVYTRIYVGNGTDGDVVWEGTEPVGTLEPGESHTATKRVELSLSDGLAIRDADGWITVQTTVDSANRTMTFAERRQVA